MLQITEEAKAFLARLLEEKNTPENMAARFVFNRDNLTVEIDVPRAGDTRFHYKDRIILVLDEEAAQILDDNTLGTQDTEDGPKLALLI